MSNQCLLDVRLVSHDYSSNLGNRNVYSLSVDSYMVSAVALPHFELTVVAEYVLFVHISELNLLIMQNNSIALSRKCDTVRHGRQLSIGINQGTSPRTLCRWNV
jgi:hypothetical protein